eukprot:scaffold27367_cov112-Isochrysis_galbana.AAC.13
MRRFHCTPPLAHRRPPHKSQRPCRLSQPLSALAKQLRQTPCKLRQVRCHPAPVPPADAGGVRLSPPSEQRWWAAYALQARLAGSLHPRVVHAPRRRASRAARETGVVRRACRRLTPRLLRLAEAARSAHKGAGVEAGHPKAGQPWAMAPHAQPRGRARKPATASRSVSPQIWHARHRPRCTASRTA